VFKSINKKHPEVSIVVGNDSSSRNLQTPAMCSQKGHVKICEQVGCALYKDLRAATSSYRGLLASEMLK
jgi:hypothetical protein